MTATLPALPAGHVPTAAEYALLLAAVAGITNIEVMSAIGTASLSTTSATYVDVTGTSMSWAKARAATLSNVLVLLAVSSFSTAASTRVMYGVHIGSTDYDVTLFTYNTVSAHHTAVGFASIPSVAAGSYTPIVRAKRTLGTGTITVDAGDTVSMLLCELSI